MRYKLLLLLCNFFIIVIETIFITIVIIIIIIISISQAFMEIFLLMLRTSKLEIHHDYI